MLALKFNNPSEYKLCLERKTFQEHWTDKFNEKSPYLILIEKYKGECETQLNQFKGKRMVIIDSGDKPNYWSPFIDVCTNSPHIYIKDNSYTDKGHKNVRIGCYSPSMSSVSTIIKHDIVMRDKTKDVFFAGDMHCSRKKKIYKMLKLMPKYDKIDICGKDFDRKTYLKKMSKARYTLCPEGKGNRTRREWEAILVGSVPIVENRDIPRPMINIGFIDYENTRKCWIDNLRIDLRMAAVYAFTGCDQMWTYEDVEKMEKTL